MKLQQSLRYILIIAILVAVNFFFSGLFHRIDLTQENRYSLSPVSINTVDSLEYPMTVQVFMEGDFPPNIRRFQDAVSTNLTELKQYAHNNLDFEFVNPTGNKELMQELVKKGMPPIPVTMRTSASDVKKTQLLPYALMRYKEQDVYIDLVKGCVLPDGQIDFLKAEADLEYKLVAPMRRLTRKNSANIAIIEGHGEIPIEQMGEWVTAMQNSYQVFRYDMRKNAGNGIAPTLTEADMKAAGKELPENIKYKNGIDLVIIAQPQRAFTEREKYELDQYLMRGGSIFWVLGQEIVDMDMYEKRSTMTQLRELNLDDLFLKYGFKINYNLIQDLTCEKTEVFMDGPSGGTFQSSPWLFYPMLYNFPTHPITRNTEQVLLRYASSIDTVHQADNLRVPFLISSPNSRTIDGQQFIDLNQYLTEKPPVQLFKNKGNKIAGLLVEGMFNSLFVGREAPTDSLAPNPPTATFGAKSGVKGKIAIISDGNFPMGKLFRGKRGYLPYDNKTILMNTVDYLIGDPAVTQIRSKEVQSRTLSKEKVVANAGMIRFLNLILPILLLALFGVVRYYWRKRKNEG